MWAFPGRGADARRSYLEPSSPGDVQAPPVSANFCPPTACLIRCTIIFPESPSGCGESRAGLLNRCNGEDFIVRYRLITCLLAAAVMAVFAVAAYADGLLITAVPEEFLGRSQSEVELLPHQRALLGRSHRGGCDEVFWGHVTHFDWRTVHPSLPLSHSVGWLIIMAGGDHGDHFLEG